MKTTMATGGLSAEVKLQPPELFDRTMDVEVLGSFFLSGTLLYFDGVGG